MSTCGSANRREFLKTTGMLTGVLALGSPLALLAPSRSWALDLTALSSEQGRALLAASRTLLPHDRLDDVAYAAVVNSADQDAARDAALKQSLTEGIAALGAGFADADPPTRIAALGKLEPTPFFQQLRVRSIQVLYSTALAQALLGYEGEAFSKGGYLLRGFNDLRWLPEVPLADAGPVPGAGS
jgi:hypothetical protein